MVSVKMDNCRIICLNIPPLNNKIVTFCILPVLTRVRGKFLVVLGLGKWLALAKNVLSLTVLTKRDGPGHVTILIAISKNYLTSCRPYKDIIRILVNIRIF